MIDAIVDWNRFLGDVTLVVVVKAKQVSRFYAFEQFPE